jgi:hypothetical protein
MHRWKFYFEWIAFFSALVSAQASESGPLVVFDLDRTLFNPNPRIARILGDIGRDFQIPGLTTLKTDDISALVGGDRSVLGIRDAAVLQWLFGSYREGSNRTSEFGKRFYFDSSYLVHDDMIPGASEFVRRIQQETGARILYLSARIREHFEEDTWKQLEHHGFPGRKAATLILKPLGEGETPAETRGKPLTNDEFKVRALRGLLDRAAAGDRGPDRVLAIFDDSSRNLARFAAELDPRTLLVRVSSNSSAATEGRIRRVSNYLEPGTLLEQVVAVATDCESFLRPEK